MTIRVDTDLVVIDVTATDKSGAYVRDLRAEELQVFEDGRQRKVDFFRSLAEEIRASYVLAYYSESRDGKPHELRVKTSRAGVQLRASRSSYTAPLQ